MKHAILLGIFIALSVPVFGVNFASDKIILHEAGTSVKDSTTLYSTEADNRLAICTNGKLWIKQIPSPGKITFFRLVSPVTEKSQWFEQNKGKGGDDYQAYLKMAADAISNMVIIDLPEATDSTVSGAKEGMTGGVIGVSRTFVVDLEKGTVQLQAAEKSKTVETFPSTDGDDIGESKRMPQIIAISIAILFVLIVAWIIARKFIRT